MLGLLHIQINPNTYLYRETKHFSYLPQIDPKEFYTFDLNEMASEISEMLYLEKQSAIENYCFMCFLFGNDFMPHFPSLNIRNSGIPYLLEVFRTLNVNLVSGNKINWSNFKKLCNELSLTENERILENVKWKQQLKVTVLTKEDELKLLPIKDMEREIYITQHMDKYYTLFFGQCKDNYLCYEFHLAPLFSSILHYIPCFDEEQVTNGNLSIPTPITQLLYVLPYSDYDLIPVNTDNIVKKFPQLKEMNYPIHYDFCKFFWESHVEFNYICLKSLK
jgi:5'-3' exonuclease